MERRTLHRNPRKLADDVAGRKIITGPKLTRDYFEWNDTKIIRRSTAKAIIFFNGFSCLPAKKCHENIESIKYEK